MKFSKNSEEKLLGGDPKGKSLITTMSLLEAFNYYNYFFDAEDSATFINQYSIKNDLKVKVKRHDLPMNVGWIAKMLTDGCTLDSSTIGYFNRKLSEFKKKPVEKEEAPKIVVKSVFRDNIHIQHIESLIDSILRGQDVNFDFNSYSQKHSLSSIVVKSIRDYYDGNREQIENKENREYFSHDKKTLKRLIDFYSNIESGTTLQIVSNQRNRKPRKKKVQPTDKILAFIRLQTDSKDLKIASLQKERILQSDCLVLYNTKYKKISVLYAENGKKFSAHRTAITNIDVTKSYQCTLKKPEVNIHHFTKGTAPAIKKTFDALTTTKSAVESFYTNENVMIIRSF